VKVKSPLRVGDSLPNIELFNSQGKTVSLPDLVGKNVVLYFYPKDDTPGCTLEGQQFTKLKKKFEQLNTIIFGISRDSVKSHDQFICKYDFKVELLSDSDELACKAFDVIKEKSMYGKTVLGIERSTFLFNEKGLMTHEFRKVKADGHAEEILKVIKNQ
jgi:peroxiredoxin Q/BCP